MKSLLYEFRVNFQVKKNKLMKFKTRYCFAFVLFISSLIKLFYIYKWQLWSCRLPSLTYWKLNNDSCQLVPRRGWCWCDYALKFMVKIGKGWVLLMFKIYLLIIRIVLYQNRLFHTNKGIWKSSSLWLWRHYWTKF